MSALACVKHVLVKAAACVNNLVETVSTHAGNGTCAVFAIRAARRDYCTPAVYSNNTSRPPDII